MSVAFESPVSRIRSSRVAAYAGPFLVFMVLLEVAGIFRIENSALPWWRQFPEHWVYPLQVLVGLGSLWFWRKHYPALSRKGILTGVGAGLIGIVVWLLPPLVHDRTGAGDRLPWLEFLGFQSRLEGFDPGVFGESASPLLIALVVGFRFLRLVLIVSLVEEIFWRGFLMRWITEQTGDWWKFPLEKCSRLSIWLTGGAFALAHAGPDTAVAFLYGLLAGWVAVKTGNLWAVVAMHMTANFALGFFIMQTEWWGLW